MNREPSSPQDVLVEVFSCVAYQVMQGNTEEDRYIRAVADGEWVTEIHAAFLAKATNTTAEYWLNLQANYEAWLNRDQ